MATPAMMPTTMPIICDCVSVGPIDSVGECAVLDSSVVWLTRDIVGPATDFVGEFAVLDSSVVLPTTVSVTCDPVTDFVGECVEVSSVVGEDVHWLGSAM